MTSRSQTGFEKIDVTLHPERYSIMKQMEFEIKGYGRTELAQLYAPDITPAAAWKKLKGWIAFYPGLTELLESLGYQPRQRTFTPAQVRAITEAIGEP